MAGKKKKLTRAKKKWIQRVAKKHGGEIVSIEGTVGTKGDYRLRDGDIIQGENLERLELSKSEFLKSIGKIKGEKVSKPKKKKAKKRLSGSRNNPKP